jgi:hypothetical protein
MLEVIGVLPRWVFLLPFRRNTSAPLGIDLILISRSIEDRATSE